MAEVKSFRGLRYDTRRFQGELDRLVAPPYDVIDDVEQEALYAAHHYNIVRIDLNRQQTFDYPENDRYTRARRHLMDWLARGVITCDEEPVLYVHHQRFDDGRGGRVTRRGFIGRVRLHEYADKVVLPHERTLRGPKIDRLDLMKATEANLSQIFMLYDDPQSQIDTWLEEAIAGEAPLVQITTPDGIEHILWSVSDEDLEARVAEFFAPQQLLIADGHHRYETALAYRDFRRQVAEPGEPLDEEAPSEFVMTFLVNMHDPGLLVFPTHRVVHGVEGFSAQALVQQLEQDALYEVSALQGISAREGRALLDRCEQAGQQAPSFVLVHDTLPHPYLVTFRGATDSAIFDEETPEQVRALDVAVLHEGIFDRQLGISKAAQEAKTNLRYLKKLDEAIRELDDPSTQLLVLMNATPVSQVDAVCRSGGKMPQKSTYFYPKILSGLMICPL